MCQTLSQICLLKDDRILGIVFLHKKHLENFTTNFLFNQLLFGVEIFETFETWNKRKNTTFYLLLKLVNINATSWGRIIGRNWDKSLEFSSLQFTVTSTTGFYPPPPPPPEQKWLEIGLYVCKHCIRTPYVWELSQCELWITYNILCPDGKMRMEGLKSYFFAAHFHLISAFFYFSANCI
jgi:hypothetical protein